MEAKRDVLVARTGGNGVYYGYLRGNLTAWSRGLHFQELVLLHWEAIVRESPIEIPPIC